MDRETLETVQRPLKERYQTEAKAARVTLRATGTLGEDLTCRSPALTFGAGRADTV